MSGDLDRANLLRNILLKVILESKNNKSRCREDFAAQHPSKLRFENSVIQKKRSSELGVFFVLHYSFVTSTGFKPVTF